MKKYSVILHLLVLFFLISIGKANSQINQTSEVPDSFVVKFETTKGTFKVKAYREWAPMATDRFYRLVQERFYDNTAFFRVQPDYVVQFGIADNPEENEYWDNHPLPDEPVKVSNLRGTLAYAREGKNSRTTQLFINYKDNFKLDTTNFNGLRGFPPFAKVVQGMEVVEQFYSEYGFTPAEKQDSIYQYGNSYLKRHYPHLDYIEKATIIENIILN
jgi:cyclophilin family peptidyl-prolyl cis-trans isomerase